MIYQDLELKRGDTWQHQFDMLPELLGWDRVWFTAREERDAADATSLLQVQDTDGGDPSDGLVYLNAAAKAYAGGAVDEGKAWLTQAIDLNPALLAGDPPKVLDNLAAFALSPLAGDSAAFMDRLMSNLPEREGLHPWSRRKTRGLLHAVAAFEHHQDQDRAAAARNAFSALVRDPAWMRNRGVLSILTRGIGR